MSDVYPFSVRSWSDIYQILRAKAEASRGTLTLTTDGATSATFPRTTVRDLFAIVLVFDQAVTDHGSSPLVGRWTAEVDLLAGEPEAGAETYVGNRSLWESIASAAIELDRVHAALPAPSLIDTALHELTTRREPHAHAHAHPPRNAETTLLLTVFSEPTWQAMAVRQFEFFRALRGDGHDRHCFLPAVPSTRNADVVALADYWSDQLAGIGDHASDTFHRLVFSAWREVLYRVRQVKHRPAHDTYEHNFEFWSALLLLATQSDARDEAPTPWAFEIPTLHEEPRNAAAVDTGPVLEFPAAKTWDDAAQMQRDAFAKLRGEDSVTGRLVGRVPRTTVADVRQLAAYWSNGLAKAGEHSFADLSHHHVLERWKAAVAEVDHVPLNVDPASVYPHNTDFWEALLTIAIQVAVTAEAPTRWQLAKEATRQAITELPNTLRTAVQGVVGSVLAKPLLYAGIGIGGLAIAAFLLRRPALASKP